jgi:alpha-tubulin suppressor-like RCC1 family protein
MTAAFCGYVNPYSNLKILKSKTMKKPVKIHYLMLLLSSFFAIKGHAQGCWMSVLAGGYHTIAQKTDGTLWAWGGNYYGQLGDGTNVNKNTPIQIGTATNWKAIAAGYGHTIALKTDGTLWAWGYNEYGQLGDGTNVNKNTPIQIGTATNWKAITAKGTHTIALKTDGTLWAWGYNVYGQLGDGTTDDKNTPIQIGAATNWKAITTGLHHTIALKTDGTLWAWGYNVYGQLGDGTTDDKNTPIQIGAATNWKAITPGRYHTIALKTDGTLWAWGYNDHGQLGDGTNTNKNTPIQIKTATNWHETTAGYGHTLALKTDNTLWAWGYNVNGQLGDGTNADKNTPIQIGIATNWQTISNNEAHNIALRTDGTLWAWGYNYFGQLGDGTTASKYTPTLMSSCVDINNGPIAHYPLDGDATDKSPNKFDGKVENSINLSYVNGRDRKKAAQFPGNKIIVDNTGNVVNQNPIIYLASAKDVTAGRFPNFSPKKFTVSAWCNGEGVIVRNRAYGYYLGVEQGKAIGNIWINSSQRYQLGGKALSSDWHLLTLTYDGAIAKLYVDAILSDHENNLPPSDPFFAKDDAVVIGNDGGIISSTSNSYNGFNTFKGLIQDVRFYDRAISLEEITVLYGQPPLKEGLEKGLIAYYPLDGNENDFGPNKLHGKLAAGIKINYKDFGNGQKAAEFDGSNSIHLENSSSLAKSMFSPKAFTISTLFKPKFFTGNAGSGSLVTNSPLGYQLYYKTGKGSANYPSLKGYISTWNTNTSIPIRILNIVDCLIEYDNPDGSGYHSVLTYQDGILKIYYNGELKGSKDIGPGLFTGYGSELEREITIGSGFLGLMQNVRFYDRSLTPEEVTLLYKLDVNAKTITSIFPNSCGKGTKITTFIKGKGFTEKSLVSLKRVNASGKQIISAVKDKIKFISDSELEVEWYIPANADRGDYDLEISDFIDGSTQIKKGFFKIQDQILSHINVDFGQPKNKISMKELGKYKAKIIADGNTPIENALITIVVKELVKDKNGFNIQVDDVLQSFPDNTNLNPLQRHELQAITNGFVKGIDDEGFTNYTMVISKPVIYPQETNQISFTITPKAPTKYVFGTQNAIDSYDPLKKEQGCSDCLKCTVNTVGLIPFFSCPADIAATACTILDAKQHKAGLLDVLKSFVSTGFSCLPVIGQIFKSVGNYGEKIIKIVDKVDDSINVGINCPSSCRSTNNGPFNIEIRSINGLINEDTIKENEKQVHFLDGTSGKTSQLIYGPDGVKDKRYIKSGSLMPYTIEFKNEASTSDTIGLIRINDQLDTNVFDLSSFRFSSYGLGDTIFNIDSQYEDFLTYDSDLRPRKNIILRHIASFDRVTGAIEYQFISLDPSTYDPILIKSQGFLPPNDSTHQGYGFVEYLVNTKDNLPHDTKIQNKADITYDSIPPISTTSWVNNIDDKKPTSRIKPLPLVTKDTTFNLIIEAADVGSGIKFYDIYISENKDLYRRIGTGFRRDTIKFTGKNGSTYSFFSMARDSVGNWEDTTHTADVTVKIDRTNPVKELRTGEIKIYPNPTTGTVYVESPWENTPAQIIVSDVIGRTVLQQKSIQTKVSELDLRSFSAGIYFISLKNERTGETKVGKVVHE